MGEELVTELVYLVAGDCQLTAKDHCQRGTETREIYKAMDDSQFKEQDFSGVIDYLMRTNLLK